MRIISKKKITEFCKRYPEAENPLMEWYKKTKAASWQNISEVKATFPHADAVGTCTVFNVAGNKYRVITWIVYEYYTVYIKNILTHKEYDQEAWKSDCKK